MTGNPAETTIPAIDQLVLALAKTYHWSGLYGMGHPILAKRVDELHAALLARLSQEPGGRLFLGIARDKVLYRDEFLGEGQELIARLTESLYLRRVATMGFEPDVTPEGLLSLLRYLHDSTPDGMALSPEESPLEREIAGISLSPINYKELLSRKLADSQETSRGENREEELWRLLLTADFSDKNEEAKIMEELFQTPSLLRAIFQRSWEREGIRELPSWKTPLSAGMVQKVVRRISRFLKEIPKDRKKEFLSKLDTSSEKPEPGGGKESDADFLPLARLLVEDYTDEDFIELLSTVISVEGRVGKRLRRVFGILAGERNAANSLFLRAKEKVRETRRAKDYYAQKTWEAVEKLLLTRDEETYLKEDYRRFLEEISSLRKPLLQRIGTRTPDAPEIQKAFTEPVIREKTLGIFLEILKNESQENTFFEILEDVRKAIPNLISMKDFNLLHTVLNSLDSLATNTRAEWRTRVRDTLMETDFAQIGEIILAGQTSAEDNETIQQILSKFSTTAVAPLLDGLLLEPVASRRRSLIRLLVSLGPVAVPVILERMSHPKWYYVRNLCTVLGEIGDRRAVAPLMQAASHPDIRVRREAIQAIGKLGAPEAVTGLGKILLEERFFSSGKDDLVRIDAASALFLIGGTESIAFLHRGKKARRTAVRSHCDALLQRLTGA